MLAASKILAGVDLRPRQPSDVCNFIVVVYL